VLFDLVREINRMHARDERSAAALGAELRRLGNGWRNGGQVFKMNPADVRKACDSAALIITPATLPADHHILLVTD
jgi:hypothetical protein